LLTRSFGQRAVECRDTFTVPRVAQAAGRIYREKLGLETGQCQLPVARSALH
jgi:hypothetical protein